MRQIAFYASLGVVATAALACVIVKLAEYWASRAVEESDSADDTDGDVAPTPASGHILQTDQDKPSIAELVATKLHLHTPESAITGEEPTSGGGAPFRERKTPEAEALGEELHPDLVEKAVRDLTEAAVEDAKSEPDSKSGKDEITANIFDEGGVDKIAEVMNAAREVSYAARAKLDSDEHPQVKERPIKHFNEGDGDWVMISDDKYRYDTPFYLHNTATYFVPSDVLAGYNDELLPITDEELYSRVYEAVRDEAFEDYDTLYFLNYNTEEAAEVMIEREVNYDDAYEDYLNGLVEPT